MYCDTQKRPLGRLCVIHNKSISRILFQSCPSDKIGEIIYLGRRVATTPLCGTFRCSTSIARQEHRESLRSSIRSGGRPPSHKASAGFSMLYLFANSQTTLEHGLAPGGVYHSAISLRQREGLTPHFSPIARAPRAVLSLWHFPYSTIAERLELPTTYFSDRSRRVFGLSSP